MKKLPAAILLCVACFSQPCHAEEAESLYREILKEADVTVLLSRPLEAVIAYTGNWLAYYNTYDLTPLLKDGTNANGWYAVYVGYGKLVGYGPHKTGRKEMPGRATASFDDSKWESAVHAKANGSHIHGFAHVASATDGESSYDKILRPLRIQFGTQVDDSVA